MDVFDAIKNRRSIRKYQEKDVSDEILQKILDAGNWAPSAANKQPWEFVTVRSAETKNRLQEIVDENAAISAIWEPRFATYLDRYGRFVKTAPVIVIVLVDPSRTGPHVFGEKTYLLSVGAAIQNILLATHTLGLGAVWITMYNEFKVKALIRAPKEYEVAGIVPIGHPAEERKSSRKSLKVKLHSELFEQETQR